MAADESPRRAEHRFDEWVGGVADHSIILLDAAGIVARRDSAAEPVEGAAAEGMLGRHPSRDHPPEVAETRRPEDELRRAEAEGRPGREGWPPSEDGTRSWDNVVSTAMSDEAGCVRGFPRNTRVLSGRERAEESLRQTEERFRLLVEGMRDYAIFMLDTEGFITTWNVGAERIKGYTAGEIVGQHFSRLYTEEGVRRGWPAQGLAIAAARGQFEDEGWRVRKDGTRFWASVLITALRGRDGTLVGYSKVTRDLTERKRAEERLRRAHDELELRVAERTDELRRANEALREAGRRKGELLDSLREGEERFRTMAESIPQLAWMARPDGHIYWYNRRWYDYTGTTPEQMEGWGWQRVHDPDHLPAALGRWKESIASGEPFDMVFPLRGADGRFRPFLTRVMPSRGEGGEVAHWFGTNTDISDRLRIEEELRAVKDEAEAANRAKTQFLAVLSHELRTPLNPILLAVSSLLESPSPAEEIRPTLEMIRQNVNLQARLIDDLLDVMRIVRGKMPLNWEVADCHELIDQAVRICRSQVLAGGLRLGLDLSARHRHVHADPARLQQVFWNLIKNAVKFTPGGGSIAIRTRSEPDPGGMGGRIAIEVGDTGIGIEPEVLPTIFDPFQQGETTITRRYGGLGLGLAICKGIVEAHGGTLEAESRGRDLGTTFRVVLKALPEPEVEEGGEPGMGLPEAVPAPPSPLRILVVEDEPATLRLMARLLRGLGHGVETASTIASAYRAFEAGDFDLLVSDIGLPDGTGLDLMRRAVALRGQIPAIALTGYGMQEDIARSREAGFTAHMTKPIDFGKLEAMIRQVANKPTPAASRVAHGSHSPPATPSLMSLSPNPTSVGGPAPDPRG